ncbi:carbohydrate-binding protein [Actinoplanes ianthinogenes]|uniref:Carbohydrate-binding protein n=1 Tax=Actinoplanes ianthinogenes TaxID=122358 RepID=A0ABM7M2M5_9ACTN|nr:RICIN domain-containing protein [Actinoplanes ianthinogenes]BCJ45885.1 carbohydrate-binding protein [Actinoplanes ianthinogenes]GGR31357.1 carbohydrate-binding protein [Actinoplanes ianthinogenes]
MRARIPLVLLLLTSALTLPSAPVTAATTGFRGVNWADQRDNFVDDTLVLGGLSTADSYATTQAKANAILTGFATNLGADTVRMPVNYPTVAGSYWASYTGAIDMAAAKGMKVILSYWEANSSRDGKVDNAGQYWSMWQTIVSRYSSNASVYFEPFNEPYGYSDADWKNLAAQWLSTYSGVPRGRVIISGAGYNQRLTTIGGDTRFDGTLISRHIYQFFDASRHTEDSWRESLRSSVGAYANRVVITEFGATMTDGRNFDVPSTTNDMIAFIRGVAAEARAEGLGTVYWPGVRVADPYRLQEISGSGTALTLTTTNNSGRDQLRYSWGLDVAGNTPLTHYRVTSRASGKAMDLVGSSIADGAEVKQYTWNGGANQKWSFEDLGNGYVRVVNQYSGKCLDVASASAADGANVIQYTCGSGTNQQWSWVVSGGYGTLVARHSGKCLDVVGSGTADGVDIHQYTCNGGANQQWTRSAA